VDFSAAIKKIRYGFHPNFWIANGMELFERLAYYSQAAIFSVFLRDHLHLSLADAGKLQSLFGGLIYSLPILGGTLADKFGFRRAFSTAFGILAAGYLLIGSTGMDFFAPLYAHISVFWTLVIILIFTAFGGSFIKPSVLGTVAVASTGENKSLGYAVYYWLVNIGAAIGPALAYLVRNEFGIEFVYLISSASCLLMFIVNAFFYKNIAPDSAMPVESLGTKLKNLVVVLRNTRFMVFLLIFSLFWIMFWQEFIIVPFYVRDFISRDAPFEIIASAGAWGIIVFQLFVNRLTRNLPADRAIVAGFAVASLSWLVVALHPAISTMIATIVVFSIGEMTQAPRYYEYISNLAPPGQQGLYQGYGFLPIALAYALGGILGTWMYDRVAVQAHSPGSIWFVLFGVGVLATVLMMLYNIFSKKKAVTHVY
jgi:proton-dependent oligopeptide transporter, POT family